VIDARRLLLISTIRQGTSPVSGAAVGAQGFLPLPQRLMSNGFLPLTPLVDGVLHAALEGDGQPKSSAIY